jgi:pimeloyl-ACP methyl ester carboxylesterase
MSARTVAVVFMFLFEAMMFDRPLSATAPITPKPSGKLVDLGGHRLHVNCTGKGAFTVVVEDGLGDFSFDWVLVQTRVEKFTRICTYDRGGYAWSDPGPKPRSHPQLNLELHDALNKLGEHGSLILVGHSFGGSVIRSYAATYPAQVAGMVLIDTVQEDQRILMGPKKTGRVRDSAKGIPVPEPRENMLASDSPDRPNLPAAPIAVGNVEPPFDRLPQKEQDLQRWAEQLPELNDAEDSQKEWSTEYMAHLHATPQEGSLGAIPLIVLSRTESHYGNDLDVPAAELEADRLRLQARLALLSSEGKLVLVPSGHNMHLEAPDAVADAIKSVFRSCSQKVTK